MVPIFGDSLRPVLNETDGGAALGRPRPAGFGQPAAGRKPPDQAGKTNS